MSEQKLDKPKNPPASTTSITSENKLVSPDNIIGTVADKINESMTTGEMVKILVEALGEYEIRLEDLALKSDNIKSVLDVISGELKRMASSFRPVESVATQNQPRRIGDGASPSQSPRQPSTGDGKYYKFEWRPCGNKYPGSADEYGYFDTAPENVRAMCRDGATFEGYRYRVSKSGKYVYRTMC